MRRNKILRAVAFKNFIYFRDHQSLEFEDGPNFIVGANATGKSAIFELIRRSLSNTANISTSTVMNKECPAFVLCKFELAQSLSNNVPEGCCIYSFLYVKHLEDGSKETCKLVYIANTPQGACYLDCCNKHIDESEETKTFTLLNDNSQIPDQLESLLKSSCKLNMFNEMIHKEKQLDSIGSSSQCEIILQAIHDAVVFTFPIRSPGPIQWSHTRNIGKGSEHYDTASKRAEIFQQLLQSPDVDEEDSKDLFETIIHPLKYTFERNQEDSTIIVNDGERHIRLLKVPEGIIEAKQFALIFAHQKFQTIMLEEPDRGMHPPMIQNLRDLVLRRHTKGRKMVLVFTSHHPAMINQWAMSRLHVCRRKRDADGTLNHSVFKLSDRIKNVHQEEEKLKQMLYSAAVLFVEGTTDKTVIGSVFDRVLEADHLDGFTKEELDDLQKIAAKTQVISINGSKPYNILKTMGENIEIPSAFLLDKDTLFKCMAKVRPTKVDKEWRNSTLFCIRIRLQRMKRDNQGKRMTEPKDKKKEETLQKVLNTPITNDESVRHVLKLNDTDLERVTMTTVESFIRSVVLPTTFDLKPAAVEAYALPQKIKDSKNNKVITDHMRRNKGVFQWDSGNLEDMICRSILDFGGQRSENHSTPTTSNQTGTDRNQKEQNQKKENLLQDIFLCENYNEEGSKPKDPVKEALKQMDITTAERIAISLLENGEMRTFLRFMLDFDKGGRPQP